MPLVPISCVLAVPKAVTKVGGTILDSFLVGLSDAIGAAIKAMVGALSSWIFIRSDPVCPAPVPDGGVVPGDWVTTCQHAASPAATLNSYVLPITVLVAVFGVLWQAIMMVVTRRGEPLLQVIRGLWNTVLWGAVGIAGTQLALHASDSFATWILTKTLHNADFSGTLSALLVTMLPGAPLLAILGGIAIIFVIIIQVILMIFRDAAIAILAGMLQLAAAGTFTQATSPWKTKVVGWMLALIAYKPAAALCYATGLAFMSGHASLSNFLVGLAVLALSVIALPTLMKFFTWTVGTIGSGGGGLGMFGAGAAAGLHGAASLRGLGGNTAAEHTRYMGDHGPGTGRTGGAPTGAASPKGPRPGGGTGGAGVIDGQIISSGPAAPGTSAMATATVPAGTGATASTAGSAASGASAGAASGAASAGAADGVAAAGAAATGPAAPIVLGAVVVGQTAVRAARSAADHMTEGGR